MSCLRQCILLIFLSSILLLPCQGNWDAEIVALARTIPIQHSGRIKPLDTFARIMLLKMNGKRSCHTSEGKKLTPTEWLLDCLFYPEKAVSYKAFLVENDDLLDIIQVEHQGRKKRSRYTYNDLLPGRRALLLLAQEYAKIEDKKRGIVQRQIVHLAENIRDAESLFQALDFARETYDTSPEILGRILGENPARFSTVLQHGKELVAVYTSINDEDSQEHNTSDSHALKTLLERISNISHRSTALAIFPPISTDIFAWMTPADIAISHFVKETSPAYLGDIKDIERIIDFRDNPQECANAFRSFHNRIVARADQRGEYTKILLEVRFYQGKYFFYGLFFYVISFIFVAFSWLIPSRRKFPKFLASLALLGGTCFVVIGITMRCIIRSRPPVSTLYETILFITAVSVLVALLIEWINRQGIAQAIAAFLGSAGMFLANKYELKERADTMTSLVAVLDSNYWLSIHVTTVTIGYAAGLLASAIAHGYLIGKILGIKKQQPSFYREITRMTYGTICFGLLFSVVGTILGGLWANDSWGRFWGWDPKENGALMIVLWELWILHARMGGYIRDVGMSLAAIFGGCIVVFSWWGVNLLGVGLHSYGFESGAWRYIITFYILEGMFVLLGMFFVTWVIKPHHPRQI